VLKSPAAASRWLPNHECWIEPPPASFALERALHFRSRLHRVPVQGELRVLELGAGRMRAHIRIGLFAFEARFSVGAEPEVEDSARLGLVLTLSNRIAVVSGSLDRFAVRKLASELAEQTLAALTHCIEEGELA
jgi:hypothetical protein